jgi:hypothetical protein
MEIFFVPWENKKMLNEFFFAQSCKCPHLLVPCASKYLLGKSNFSEDYMATWNSRQSLGRCRRRVPSWFVRFLSNQLLYLKRGKKKVEEVLRFLMPRITAFGYFKKPQLSPMQYSPVRKGPSGSSPPQFGLSPPGLARSARLHPPPPPTNHCWHLI